MKWLKVGAVVFGAVLITALGIDAADTFSGSRSTLLGQLIATEEGACPQGMIEVPAAPTFTCVDMYEASPGPECTHQNVSNLIDGRENIADAACVPVSEPQRTPWTEVNREDAQMLCIRAGKRLPTNEEWYFIAQGTPDTKEDCNITKVAPWSTGSGENCKSAAGVFDAVGNVWEWTRDDVIDQIYQGRTLPEEGYVLEVDSDGVATQTHVSVKEAMRHKDYFWSKKNGAFGIMRGGYYGSKEDAGVYAVHAATPPSTTGAAVGFRCVR